MLRYQRDRSLNIFLCSTKVFKVLLPKCTTSQKKLKLRDQIHIQDDWRWLEVNLVSVLLL